MDENLNENVNQEEQGINAEELKNETQETINQVKENLKNVDVKEEAKAAKGFIGELIKNPLGKVNEIANDASNKFFKTALVLLIAWVIIELVKKLKYLINGYGELVDRIVDFIQVGFAPIVSVLGMSVILLWLNKKEKKSLITYITTITTVKLPLIAADAVAIVSTFVSEFSKISGKVYTFARLISTVLLFFAIKFLSNEQDDKKAFNKFVIVEAVWIVVYFIISFVGVSMY